MHVQMRRVPAERARHAKRLGPVVLSTAPATPTPTQTTQTTSTTPSASPTQPSSSAPPTSSPSPSSSSVSSSATTSSTHSSATSSVSPQSSSTTRPPPSITTQPAGLTSTYPVLSSTPTPTPTSAPQTPSAPSSALSGGAIAGIIAGAVIVGVALIVFFVRKTYLRRRERKLIAWDEVPGAGIFDEPKYPDIGERSATPPPRGLPFESRGQSMYPTPVAPAVRMQPPTPSYAVPSPPPATYNNPTAYPTPPAPSTYGLGNTASFTAGRVAAPAQHAQAEAIVKCTFVPTLPDELSITTGERIFIVEQYDDGWDLCANGRGERGMVPRECLDRAPSDQPDIGWMNAGRMSSLNDGQRY